jgi:hypothetical protein
MLLRRVLMMPVEQVFMMLVEEVVRLLLRVTPPFALRGLHKGLLRSAGRTHVSYGVEKDTTFRAVGKSLSRWRIERKKL